MTIKLPIYSIFATRTCATACPCWELWRKIAGRYLAIRDECAINFPIEDELDAIYENLSPQTSADFLASRGEYLAAKLMAAYLGFSFVDAASWLQFDYAGNVLTDTSYAALSSLADGRKIVTPGFYGALPTGASIPSRAAAPTLQEVLPPRRCTRTCMKTGRMCRAF